MNLTQEHYRSYAEAMVYLVIISIQFVLSVVGNALVCYVIVNDTSLRMRSMTTIFNLAITDICYPIVSIIPSMTVMVTGRWALGGVACQLFGYLLQVLALASIENMTVIAVTRYILVCHPDFARKHLNKNYYIWTTVMTWVLPNAICLPTVLGWGKIEFNYKMAICIHNWHLSAVYAAVLVLLAFFIPLVVVIVFYTKLFVTVREIGRIARTSSTDASHTTEMEIKLAKMTCCIFLSFVICWMPVSTLIYLDLAGVPVSRLFMCSMICAFSNGVSNPIIYSLMNTNFRSAFKKLFTQRPVTAV